METNIRSLHQWIGGFRVAQAEFDPDALVNFNTPADLAACQENQVGMCPIGLCGTR